MRAVFGGHVPVPHLVTGGHASSDCPDKVPLFIQNLRWPDNGPDGNTKNERKSIEDVEPEFDSSERTVIPLGKLCYSENTSDLSSDEVRGNEEGHTMIPIADHRRA